MRTVVFKHAFTQHDLVEIVRRDFHLFFFFFFLPLVPVDHTCVYRIRIFGETDELETVDSNPTVALSTKAELALFFLVVICLYQIATSCYSIIVVGLWRNVLEPYW